MALLSTSHSLFFTKTLNVSVITPSISKTQLSLPCFSKKTHKALIFTPNYRITRFPFLLPIYSSISDASPDPEPVSKPDSDSTSEPKAGPASITDEWGEKAEPEPEPEPEYPKAADADPPRNEDEWEEEYGSGGNGSASVPPPAESEDVAAEGKDERVEELKRCLVDTVYGTDLGFGAGSEIRAEVLELVSQLEALNPNPAPVDAPGLLDGNWVLVYTASSELLPLLAVGITPLLKVKSISQAIDTSNQSIVNSTTLSSPAATFSFSASASFEVRSPSRIQVEFKEGSLQPPEIKSSIDLPENVEIFGQKISLTPVQQSINPLQEAVATISRTISGQPPLKLPIPGNRAANSWLLITYLDEDFRISRGDGGLFVLVKEGSPLLYQ